MKSSINNIEFINKHKNIIFLLFMFVSSIILYILCSTEISTLYNNLCFFNALVSLFLYYKIEKKENYFDFDTIFIVVFFIINYAYPIFLFDINNPFILFFGFDFDLTYFNKATILSTLGIQAYFIGSVFTPKKKFNAIGKSIIKTNFLIIVVIILSISFILTGGVEFYQSMYLGEGFNESGIFSQIMVLLHAFSIIVIATEFYNKKIYEQYKINKIVLIVIIATMGLMLYAGNRTFASQLALPILGLGTMYFRNFNKKEMFIFFVISIIAMWSVQVLRTGKMIESPTEYAVVISDLTIPTRNNYVCQEYVEKFGYSYGSTMAGGLIGIIPSLERVLSSSFNIETRNFGSAEVLTTYTFGSEEGFGLGTTIIADIYLSFGVIGVVILMCLLGNFVKKVFNGSTQLNYYSIILYSVMLSYSVYLSRTTYTHPVKLLIWCLVISKVIVYLSKFNIKVNHK